MQQACGGSDLRVGRTGEHRAVVIHGLDGHQMRSNAGVEFDPEQGNASGRRTPKLGELLRAAGNVLRRRILVFGVVALATAGLGGAVIVRLKPTYEATARIRLDPSRSPVLAQRDATSELSDEAIDTEVSALSSPQLARDVARLVTPAGPPAGQEAEGQELLAHLNVHREKLTYILAVSYSSHDPYKASVIANAFAQTYLSSRVGRNADSAGARAEWLKQQLQRSAAEVGAAEARLGQFKAQTGTMEGGPLGTIVDQQIAPLSNQLASAQSEAAAARANLTAARDQAAKGGTDAVSEVRSSPVIGDLRRQKAELARDLAEMTSRYGERHPDVIKVREQIAALDGQIDQEEKRALDNLQANAASTSARAGSLAGSLADLRRRQAEQARAAVVADQLSQDVQSKRAAYDRLAQQQSEADQSAHNSIATAEIVSLSTPPGRPKSPNRPLLAGATVIAALALGGVAIALQEMAGAGLRSVSDVENGLGLRLLASVPRAPRRGRQSPAGFVIAEPASLFAETLRNLRASLLGRRTDGSRVIAFTSSVPEEGKTVTALALARSLAMGGIATILIDCDLRKASVGRLVTAPEGDGIVELLAGGSSIAKATVHDVVPGLGIIRVSRQLFTAEDVFGDERMGRLLAELKTRCSVVLLDLPPVLGVADARTLAQLADETVMVVRWGATPRRAVEQALKLLRGDGVKVAGAVYTLVDPRAEAVGSLFYSKKYSGYYQRATRPQATVA